MRQEPTRADLASGRPLLVVAVDGVLADTLPLRTAAFDDAQRAVLGRVVRETSVQDVAGLCWAQLACAVAPAEDVTLIDLLALAAERAFGRSIAAGAPLLHVEAIARTRACAEHGWRVVLRADSSRRAAASLFDALAERTLATRVIAAEDGRASHGELLREVQDARPRTDIGRAPVHVVELVPPGTRFAPLPEHVSLGWPAP